MTQPGENQPEDNGTQLSERPSLFAVAGLLVGILAALAAVLVVSSARRVSSGLLIFAGLTLIVLWVFTAARESRWFSITTTVALAIALIGIGGYLFVPVKHTDVGPILRPTPPLLYFADGTSARVPWCANYVVQARGSIPAGYQVVIFDASTDDTGKATSHYSFDNQARPTGKIPGQFKGRHLFIGTRSAPVGYLAVVVAGVIKDNEASLLEDIGAYKNEWGLSRLPIMLSSKSLPVMRNNDRAYCPGTKPKTHA